MNGVKEVGGVIEIRQKQESRGEEGPTRGWDDEEYGLVTPSW